MKTLRDIILCTLFYAIASGLCGLGVWVLYEPCPENAIVVGKVHEPFHVVTETRIYPPWRRGEKEQRGIQESWRLDIWFINKWDNATTRGYHVDPETFERAQIGQPL